MLRNNRNTPNWSKLYFRFNSKNALFYFCLLTKIGFWCLHKICLNFKMNQKSLQSNACTSSYSWNTRTSQGCQTFLLWTWLDFILWIFYTSCLLEINANHQESSKYLLTSLQLMIELLKSAKYEVLIT